MNYSSSISINIAVISSTDFLLRERVTSSCAANRIAFAFSEDMGWLVENVVFCHLKQHHEEVYYHSNDSDTDFVVKEGMKITKRIQVWYEDVSEIAIPDRELACFRKPLIGHEAAETLLVNNDFEDVIDTGVARVRCIPAIKFLLELGQPK